MSDFPVEAIKSLFLDALCDFNFNIQPHGYFNKCQINTYLLVVPQLLLLAYTVPKLTSPVEGGWKRTNLKKVKFALACLQVIITSLFGPEVFNVISLTVSYPWLFICFLCAFMELNGILVPRKPLLGYYFICCVGYGYYVVGAVAKGTDLSGDTSVHAAIYLFLISFVNACIRDIGDAVEQNETITPA